MREIIAAVLAALAIRFFVMEFIRVKGGSMRSTLENGQVLLVEKLRFRLRGPARGDVIICKYPGRYLDKHKLIPQYFVKRVIGLPGERIAIEEGVVLIDGLPLSEPYLSEAFTHRKRTMPERILGEGEYFVLGDNRDSSNDSRSVGPLPRRMLVGRACRVLWPIKAWKRL